MIGQQLHHDLACALRAEVLYRACTAVPPGQIGSRLWLLESQGLWPRPFSKIDRRCLELGFVVRRGDHTWVDAQGHWRTLVIRCHQLSRGIAVLIREQIGHPVRMLPPRVTDLRRLRQRLSLDGPKHRIDQALGPGFT